MRVTITKSPGVFNSYGILMPTGSIQTVTDDFGKSLVFSLQATDTDGVLTVAPNPPFEMGASQLPGIYTVATLPAAASYQAGTQAYTTDSQMMVSTNRGWLAAAPAVISIAQQRAKRIAAFNLGAAIAAPAWVASATVVVGQCSTVPTASLLAGTVRTDARQNIFSPHEFATRGIRRLGYGLPMPSLSGSIRAHARPRRFVQPNPFNFQRAS